MALWQGSSRRSKTGRRIRYARGKRKFEIGREQHFTTLGNTTLKVVRTKGDNRKTRVKTEIVTVKENAANIHYVRRNIINKGAIIETKLGKAQVTSRPGQCGTINAVLLSK